MKSLTEISTNIATVSSRKVYESGEDPIDLTDDDEDGDDDENDDIDEDDNADIDGGYDVGIDDDIYYSNESNVTNKNIIKGEGTNPKSEKYQFFILINFQKTKWLLKLN